LVGELDWLVAQHPYRERLREQQMLALYRCGRQADALLAYRRARRFLTEELGIEPSRPLRDLERRILAQDEELTVAGERTQSSSADGRTRRAPIRYARSGDLNIAYEVTGAGPFDLALVSGFVSHLEKDWGDPRHAQFLDRLGSFSRLIRFDKRGTGLSDRPGDLPDLETRMDDVRAVMDAAGSERAALFGYSEGGPMALLFAATYPERVSALVLYGAFAARNRSDDYPWGPTPAERAAYAEQIEREWGWETDMHRMCPNADQAMARWWGERARAAASPGAARALIAMNSLVDVRGVLPAVRAPTLVMHRTGDLDVQVEEGRYIADRIPGARFVELPGEDHFVAVDSDRILDEVEGFLVALPA
jgi:pimeloyl-ACP methyl ester carboxylesterase